MFNGIFWILCSGAKWRDLPERYGPWKTVYQHFMQWRDDGTFEQALRHLHLRLREDGLIDLGGLTTKIHLACDSHGYPLAVILSPGQDADSRYFMPLLEQISLAGSQGRPRKRCRYVLADKGYDSQLLRQYCDRYVVVY